MKLERGSTWSKWDFHIHTPYSALCNEYGFNPLPEHKDEVLFDSYVKTLLSKAIETGIVAIGITDYFCLDGYKRIKEEYLDNPIKMKELFPEDELRAKVEDIFIFPNVELRLDTFVGTGAHSVNYHVIFSDKVKVSEIEENFLRRLELIYKPGSTLPLTKANIERIGSEFKSHNDKESRSDYIVGLELITVNYSQVIKVLSDNAVLQGKYLISIPVDEDLSLIDWNGRDYQTRKVLYQQCNMLMTSNERTRNWALAKGNEEKQVSEFGSIMPCVWGSDAHSYDKMFSPSEDRFCWIKANPTFEGLEQILFEPEERVRIQKEKPENKDAHQIIDYIVFEDEDFQKEPIYISEGLTAIIGGKSTGKSILLRHIAKSIDQTQVDYKEKRISGITSRLDVVAKVIWKDGVSGERKIIYIPQSWLNRIVDEKSGDSQLNTMLREILLQQVEISEANSVLHDNISSLLDILKHNIIDYVAACEKVADCERVLRETGRSEAFQAEIEKLEKQREDLSLEVGITDEVLQRYSTLDKMISSENDFMESVKKEEFKIDSQAEPFVYFPQMTKFDSNMVPNYDLDTVPTTREKLIESIQIMNNVIRELWLKTKLDLKQVLSDKLVDTKKTLAELQSEFLPLQQIVSRNEQLKSIEEQLQKEKEKLRKAKTIEETKAEYIVEAEKLQEAILVSREELYKAYKEFTTIVSAANTPDSELEFEAEVCVKKQELFDAISGLFDNRNMRPFKEKYKYDLLDKDEMVVDSGLFKAIWTAMTDGTLAYKAGNTTITALERLFSDWFYIHYVVKSGDDTINNMSPGKKALVLLEMIVNLERSKCPILIDQPEDDLDNRSIYTDLVTYLRSKKHERQIIVVTHNANVVIGADAEEVIIANQNGKESPNREKRFEYRAGAIENVTPLYEIDGTIPHGVLNQKGIKEQICDILEGGREAFELRRRKYINSM